mgnify:CR=1 FL=1
MSPTRCWISGALSAAVLCTLAGTAQAAGDRTPEMAAGSVSTETSRAIRPLRSASTTSPRRPGGTGTSKGASERMR